MIFQKKQKSTYEVVVHLDGRHPYLDGHELDKETRDIKMTVPATGWDDAARVALSSCLYLSAWRYWVVSVAAVRS